MEHFFKPSVCLGHISQSLPQLWMHWWLKIVLSVVKAKKVLAY